MDTKISKLVKAAQKVRDYVAYNDVLFDVPLYDSSDAVRADRRKLRAAEKALNELCQALVPFEVA